MTELPASPDRTVAPMQAGQLRLVAIVMIGNEADIVEAFVRDNLAFVDHMVIAQHNPFDGTREILAALLDEGLPLTIRPIESRAYRQAEITNGLLKEAVEQFDPHWIVPLDADEFLEAESRAGLEAELAGMTACHGRLRWINHVPTVLDEACEEHPGRRLRHRYDYPAPDPASNPYAWKLVLNGHLIGPYLDRYDLEKGSHRLVFKGVREVSSQPVKALSQTVLRHYPVRSFDQLALKAGLARMQGRLAGRNELGGTHTPRLYRIVLEGRRELVDLQSAVREYLDAGRFSAEALAATPVVVDPKRHCSALHHSGLRQPAAATFLRWIDANGDAPETSGAPPDTAAASAAARYDYCPWLFWEEAAEDARHQQLAFQAHWAASGRLRCGKRCYVSPQAGLVPDKVTLGDDCYIAAQAYVTGTIVTGSHCTINPFAIVRGRVDMGDHVRIGAHASVLGFNHNHAGLDRPIHEQGISSRGISIGSDVWIGSGALLLDGVRVGSHCIVAAGSVVTKDVPDWAVVAGNPARAIRDRRHRAPSIVSGHAPAATLRAFGRRVGEQWPEVIKRYEVRAAGEISYTDLRGTAVSSIRPLADAIEIAAAFGSLPPGQERATLVERLQACQDRISGIPVDPLAPPGPGYSPREFNDGHTAYMVLSLGYALMCLDARFAYPFSALQQMSVSRLTALLARQPWSTHAWAAGAWVDAIGTAAWMNQRHFGLPGPISALFAWLGSSCNPRTGLWGEPRDDSGWLQPVNGFYRLTRGTYAQFGFRVPYPEAALDTILAHAAANEGFAERNVNACNVLDVVHPLWLLTQASEHRRSEVLQFIERQLLLIPNRWIDRAGFAFAPGGAPSLQGTEMWLAIVKVAADVLGLADELPYSPRGVHRLRPNEEAAR